MSAGAVLERVHRSAAGACGLLSLMIAKRAAWRSIIEKAASAFEDAARDLRSLLEKEC